MRTRRAAIVGDDLGILRNTLGVVRDGVQRHPPRARNHLAVESLVSLDVPELEIPSLIQSLL